MITFFSLYHNVRNSGGTTGQAQGINSERKETTMWETLTAILTLPGTLLSVLHIIDWLKDRTDKHIK